MSAKKKFGFRTTFLAILLAAVVFAFIPQMSFTTYAEQADTNDGTVTLQTAYVNIRSTPSLSGALIATASQGDVLTVLNTTYDADGDSWTYVQLPDGTTGYAYTEILYSTDAATSTTTATTEAAATEAASSNLPAAASTASTSNAVTSSSDNARYEVREEDGTWYVYDNDDGVRTQISSLSDLNDAQAQAQTSQAAASRLRIAVIVLIIVAIILAVLCVMLLIRLNQGRRNTPGNRPSPRRASTTNSGRRSNTAQRSTARRSTGEREAIERRRSRSTEEEEESSDKDTDRRRSGFSARREETSSDWKASEPVRRTVIGRETQNDEDDRLSSRRRADEERPSSHHRTDEDRYSERRTPQRRSSYRDRDDFYEESGDSDTFEDEDFDTGDRAEGSTRSGKKESTGSRIKSVFTSMWNSTEEDEDDYDDYDDEDYVEDDPDERGDDSYYDDDYDDDDVEEYVPRRASSRRDSRSSASDRTSSRRGTRQSYADRAGSAEKVSARDSSARVQPRRSSRSLQDEDDYDYEDEQTENLSSGRYQKDENGRVKLNIDDLMKKIDHNNSSAASDTDDDDDDLEYEFLKKK